jgi:hypothetical protein
LNLGKLSIVVIFRVEQFRVLGLLRLLHSISEPMHGLR